METELSHSLILWYYLNGYIFINNRIQKHERKSTIKNRKKNCKYVGKKKKAFCNVAASKVTSSSFFRSVSKRKTDKLPIQILPKLH